MKTKTYHISNFGSFAPAVQTDAEGYVTYHVSSRYARATDAQLADWAANGRTVAIRNAAETEIAERRLSEWRNA